MFFFLIHRSGSAFLTKEIGQLLSEYFGHVVHHVTKLPSPVPGKVLNDRPSTQARGLVKPGIYFCAVTSARESRVTRPPLPRLHADNRAR